MTKTIIGARDFKDLEVQAMDDIVVIFETLDDDAVRRVLEWATARFSLGSSLLHAQWVGRLASSCDNEDEGSCMLNDGRCCASNCAWLAKLNEEREDE